MAEGKRHFEGIISTGSYQHRNLAGTQASWLKTFHSGTTFYQTLTKHQHRILTKQVAKGGAHWYIFLALMTDKESEAPFHYVPFWSASSSFSHNYLHLMCLSREAWWLAQRPAHSLFVLFWIKSRGLRSSRTNRAPYVPARLPN